jgi:hypothetical protein
MGTQGDSGELRGTQELMAADREVQPTHRSKAEKWGLLWGSTVFVLAVNLYLLIIPLETFLVRFSIGDGLVFPIVAFHVSNGMGSTYDGLTQTSGYHPLWMWLHVPLMVGAETVYGRMELVRLLWIAVSLAAVALWSLLVYRVTRHTLATALFTVVMGCFGWTIYVFYSGVETPLVLLLIALALLLADKVITEAISSVKHLGWLGLVMALTFLARLDSVFLLIPLGVLLLYHFIRRRWWQGIIVWLAAAVPLPLAYLLYNQLAFGSMMPVSAQVKILPGWDSGRSFMLIRAWLAEIAGLIPAGFLWPAVFLALLVAGGAGWLLWLGFRRERPPIGLLWLLPLSAVAHYAYYFFKVRELNVPWHLYLQFQSLYVLAALFFFLAVGWLHRRISNSHYRRAAERSFYLLCLLLLAATTLFYAQIKSVRRPGVALALQTGRWLGENLPAGSTIAMYDSFYIALLADQQHVIDFNGLVGNRQMAVWAGQGAYEAIISQYGVEYVVTAVRGACAVNLEPSLPYLYQSELIYTNSETRLVVATADTFRQFWHDGCYMKKRPLELPEP